MANLFNRSDYPVQEPSELVVGDYWAWKREDLTTDYPTGDYALTYEYHEDSGGGGNHKFTITATEANDTYYVEVPTTTTENYHSGDYIWAAYITRSSDSARIQIDEGRTKITANFADTNADLRSHAKKVLDALEAVIEGRATIDQSSMSIAGRSLSRMSIDELMTFKDRYTTEYLKEIKAARSKNKSPTGNTVKVRF